LLQTKEINVNKQWRGVWTTGQFVPGNGFKTGSALGHPGDGREVDLFGRIGLGGAVEGEVNHHDDEVAWGAEMGGGSLGEVVEGEHREKE
jgi:hypothetical protein